MSEQNEVVIRKVHDGYLVELLDCPLAYTFSSQDEAERFIGPVWQRLDYVKDLHSQALRAENARFRAVLMNMQAAWNNKNEVTSVYVWNERMKAAMADVDAALQPERGRND